MLAVVPITLREACAFIEAHHRHHKPPRGGRFALAVAAAGLVRGVATVGRTVARALDDGWTVEVNRCWTEGAPDGCTMLYAAAWRAARALGYRRLITYTLEAKGGASLRGAGWRAIGTAGGGSWNTPSRPRVDTSPMQAKLLWEAL